MCVFFFSLCFVFWWLRAEMEGGRQYHTEWTTRLCVVFFVPPFSLLSLLLIYPMSCYEYYPSPPSPPSQSTPSTHSTKPNQNHPTNPSPPLPPLPAGGVLGPPKKNQHCKISPLSFIPPNTILPDHTIIYGPNLQRLQTPGLEDLRIREHEKRGQALRRLLKNDLAKWQS